MIKGHKRVRSYEVSRFRGNQGWHLEVFYTLIAAERFAECLESLVLFRRHGEDTEIKIAPDEEYLTDTEIARLRFLGVEIEVLDDAHPS